MHRREIKSRIPLFCFISVQRLLANEWSVCEQFHVEWGTTMAGYFDSADEMPCTWLPTPCGIAYNQPYGLLWQREPWAMDGEPPPEEGKTQAANCHGNVMSHTLSWFPLVHVTCVYSPAPCSSGGCAHVSRHCETTVVSAWTCMWGCMLLGRGERYI